MNVKYLILSFAFLCLYLPATYAQNSSARHRRWTPIDSLMAENRQQFNKIEEQKQEIIDLKKDRDGWKNKYNIVKDENNKLIDQNLSLKRDTTRLGRSNRQLTKDTARLGKDNRRLRKWVNRLQVDSILLKQAIVRRNITIDSLNAIIFSLRTEVDSLKDIVNKYKSIALSFTSVKVYGEFEKPLPIGLFSKKADKNIKILLSDYVDADPKDKDLIFRTTANGKKIEKLYFSVELVMVKPKEEFTAPSVILYVWDDSKSKDEIKIKSEQKTITWDCIIDKKELKEPKKDRRTNESIGCYFLLYEDSQSISLKKDKTYCYAIFQGQICESVGKFKTN